MSRSEAPSPCPSIHTLLRSSFTPPFLTLWIPQGERFHRCHCCPASFHDQPWMLRGAGWQRVTVRCTSWRYRRPAEETSLTVTPEVQARQAGPRGIMPPSPTSPAVASRHLYVLFYIRTWMWGQVDIFVCFCKEEFSVGHNNHHQFNNFKLLLPLFITRCTCILWCSPFYVEAWLCSSADRSFLQCFYYSLKMIGQDSRHTQTHIHRYTHTQRHTLVLDTLWSGLQIPDCPFTQCDKVLMNQILIHFSQQHWFTLNTSVRTSVRSICLLCTGQYVSEGGHLRFTHLTFSTWLSII